MTERYSLPKDWRWVRLGELFALTSGKSRPTDIKKQADSSYIFPVYGGNGILGFAREYFIEEPTLVLGRVGEYCGSVHISRAKCWVSDNALFIKKMLRDDVDIKYLSFALGYLDLNRLKKQTGQPLINQKIVCTQYIPLPPLVEQKRITVKLQELIQEVELARIASEKQLEAAMALPGAYLRQVFEGEEAKKWEKKRLEEVCEIIMGQSPPSDSYNKNKAGLPFFQGKADFGTYFPVAQVWCLNPLKISQANDVLISVRAPVGPVNMADKKCCIGRGLTALRGKGNIDSWFIFFYFKNIENNWKGRGSTFDAIRKRDLEEITIFFPPILEQTRIVFYLKEKLGKTESILSTIQNQQAALDALPQAILKKAFKGEL